MPVDGQLGHFVVLDAVRPAPQHLAVPQFREILKERLREQDDVTFRDELLTGAESGDGARQLIIGYAEVFAVAVFEEDALAKIRVDSLQVTRVDRQPVFVLFP